LNCIPPFIFFSSISLNCACFFVLNDFL
jgi:hypothetical protein